MFTKRVHVLNRSFNARQSVRNFDKIINVECVDNFAETQCKNLLQKMDMEYASGYTCVHSECKICSNKGKGKLYINKKTGFYVCQKCNSQGSWSVLSKLFKAAKEKSSHQLLRPEVLSIRTPDNGVVYRGKPSNLPENLKEIHRLPEKGKLTILQQFNLPTLKNYVLEQLDVRVNENYQNLYVPIVTLGKQVVGYKTISKTSHKEKLFVSNGVSGVIIYRPENLPDASWHFSTSKPVSTAVLVTCLKDLISLASTDVRCHIICLPNGVSSLPQDVLVLLEPYHKLIFWFNSCDGSWDAMRNFSKKLEGKRCYIVKTTTDAPSPSAALANGLNLPAMVAEAKAITVEAVVSFEGLKQDVLAELLNIGKVEGVKWNRFPLLSNILKGFRRGEMTVLSGTTGCGKTTFMSEYSLDLAQQGVNTLWGSFEIPNHRLARIMLTQLAGVPLQDSMDNFEAYAQELQNLPMYFLRFHGGQPATKVLQTIEHATYVYDIAHVIIDTVQFMMGVSEDNSAIDRFWRQDNIIAGFRSFATNFNCHVTLIIHPRKERDDLQLNSIFGGAKATQEADNVLMIQDSRAQGGHVLLKVLKNRYCGNLGRMPMEFNKSRLSFAANQAQNKNQFVKSKQKQY